MERSKFERATDDELREAGWDPKWIEDDPDREGPYVVTRDPDASCGQCGSKVLGWTVLNLITASAIGQTWAHDDGQCEAEECADQLNRVWLDGYAAATA